MSLKNEVNRTRPRYNFDTLTSIDIKEIIRSGGKLNQIFEVVEYC